jgi:hypothetical protein
VTTISGRALLLLVGFAVGVLVSRVVDSGDEDSMVESPAIRQSSDDSSLVKSPTSDLPVLEDQDVDVVIETAQVDAENLPNTPQVYVDLLGPSWRSVSGEDLHWTFARETRHEAWAFQVETEIMQDVVDNEVATWAVIEHVECREMTCEVAGYLLGDSDIHPQEIVNDLDRSIWWHEQFSVHSIRGTAGGMERFLIILTAQSFDDRVRPPRPLN